MSPSAGSGQAKPFDSLTLAQDRVEWLSEPPHDCADYMEAIQDATHLGG